MDQYLTLPLYRDWVARYGAMRDELDPVVNSEFGSHPDCSAAATLNELFEGGLESRVARNERWVANQRELHSELFSRELKFPLNQDQIDSVLHDEHRSLVVAGAGTGKTATVIAKALWIQAQPESDLKRVKVLAFNAKAAEEINERFGVIAGDEALASTFHSLGLGIASKAKGKKPRLSKLAEDDRLFQAFIRSLIDEGLGDSTKSAAVIDFLSYFRYPDPNPTPIEYTHKANQWAHGHDIRSLTGVKLRSNSEALIANWLTLHGVKWEYEPTYTLDTATIRYGAYTPDFYLPDHEVYIEHCACNADGTLPESWSESAQLRYRRGMKWKRDLHRRRRATPLVETFSSPQGTREIIPSLIDQLSALEIHPQPITHEERNRLVSSDEVIAPVVTLLGQFLKLFKESGMSVDRINARCLDAGDLRGQAFMEMFRHIYAGYQERLATDGTIDFSDMIREAAEALRSGVVSVELDYLLVDEFQDISQGRANLLGALLEQNPGCRLVAVGDDWQSIYRFAGSDVQIMVDFPAIFGDTRRTDLRTSHRFGSNLMKATSQFIQANPLQLRKDLNALVADDLPKVEIVSSEDKARAQSLDEVLLRIADENNSASVLILGRYNFLEKRYTDLKLQKYHGLTVSFSSVHRAKGSEADYVVILDVVTGKFGFPSEIDDDPIMSLVISSEPGIPNAEERRLFYVAMTRARLKTFILTDDHNRSIFVDELEGEDFQGLVISSGADQRVAPCPNCGGSTLKLRVGPYGAFYACTSSAAALCHGKALKCPACGSGGLVRQGDVFTCLICRKAEEPCPNCDRGYVRRVPAGIAPRFGRPYPAFDACSTNRKNPQFTCWTSG